MLAHSVHPYAPTFLRLTVGIGRRRDDLAATHASLAEMKVDSSGIAVLLVAATGLRVSEVLALRWRHVQWDKSKISSSNRCSEGGRF